MDERGMGAPMHSNTVSLRLDVDWHYAYGTTNEQRMAGVLAEIIRQSFLVDRSLAGFTVRVTRVFETQVVD